jgi:hypothetical protein
MEFSVTMGVIVLNLGMLLVLLGNFFKKLFQELKTKALLMARDRNVATADISNTPHESRSARSNRVAPLLDDGPIEDCVVRIGSTVSDGCSALDTAAASLGSGRGGDGEKSEGGTVVTLESRDTVGAETMVSESTPGRGNSVSMLCADDGSFYIERSKMQSGRRRGNAAVKPRRGQKGKKGKEGDMKEKEKKTSDSNSPSKKPAKGKRKPRKSKAAKDGEGVKKRKGK